MTVHEFYAHPDLADGFASTAGGRYNPHRGLDVPHGLGTPVPAYSPGTVVTSEWHEGLGNIVQVRGDNGRYVGFRHLRSAGRTRAQIGDRIEVGTIVGEVSDTGTLANGYHLCTTNSENANGIFGMAGVADPWPYIQRALAGDDSAGPAAAGLSGIIRSGADWALRYPLGDLANRVSRALMARGRLPEDYPLDGDPGTVWEKGVQLTLDHSGIFEGLIDGQIERGGCYGVQDYASLYGDYAQRGGIHDGRPEILSWECFALGLERP